MRSILIDGCRLDAGQAARLAGLGSALRETGLDWRLTVALSKARSLPLALEASMDAFYPPHGRELFWPRLARGFDLFLSLDARLPLLPMPCPMVHAVGDVPGLGRGRLRRALGRARLTWFDHEQARQASEALVGHALAGAVLGDHAAWSERLHDLEAVVGRR